MSINILNLSKSYKDKIIFDSLCYEFKDNKKYVIHGENGAGKSTLIKCILNQIRYDGLIMKDLPISYCPDGGYFPSYMSYYSFIKVFSQLDNNIKSFDKKCSYYKKELSLNKRNNCKLGSMSKGEKQKALLIMTLLTESKIIILDEPTNGLDNDSKNKLVDLLIKENKLIIIISHEKELFNRDEFININLKNGTLNEY